MVERNFSNRTLFHGDNLDFLRGMNSGSVDLIATDPPFNKGRDFHATPESLAKGGQFQDRWSWHDDIQADWLADIQTNHPAAWQAITAAKEIAGDDMGAFMCFLAVRLLEMHRILAPTGSLYLHIDHTAHAYTKTLLDGIFGRANFRNEIVWCYSGGGVPKKDFPRKHDTILRYSKSGNYPFHVERKPYKENTQAVGIHSTYSGNNPIDLDRGTPVTDWWTDIPTTTGWSAENTGYPTQKPLALYERIIAASSNPGDMVLDPFCGCATTPVAAERLGRQWVGIDLWAGAGDMVEKRMNDSRQLLVDIPPQIIRSSKPPERTDAGETESLALETPVGKGKRYPSPRSQHSKLIMDLGPFCQGCGFDFGFNVRILQVDHITPKSHGGTDAYDNLTLLCPPCNMDKSDYYTLEGLRREKRRAKTMLNEGNLAPLPGQGRRKGKGRR